MGFEHVLVDRSGPFTTITMNRPQRRNALSAAHLRELTTAFTQAGESDAAGIILAGNGPVFSAGHDFADVAGADLATVRRLLLDCTELMQLIETVPQPVVARVHGLATAAGCQLVASCDLAVAAEEAAFAAPGGKGGWFCHTPMVAIARNIGRKRAAELAFTGDTISARQAMDWGLVNAVAPAGAGRSRPRPADPGHPRLGRVQGDRQDHPVRPVGPGPGRRLQPGDRGDGGDLADPGRSGGHGRVPGEAPAPLGSLSPSGQGPEDGPTRARRTGL